MSVLMPTGSYLLLRRGHPEAEDAHGVPVPAPMALAASSGPWSGAVRDAGDGSYSFRLDPAAWPVLADDVLDGPHNGTTVRLVVKTARLHRNVAASDLDHVAGTAVLQPPTRR